MTKSIPCLYPIAARHETVRQLGIACQLLSLAYAPKIFKNANFLPFSPLKHGNRCEGGKRRGSGAFGSQLTPTRCMLSESLPVWDGACAYLSMKSWLLIERERLVCTPIGILHATTLPNRIGLAGVLWRCQPFLRHYIDAAARGPVSH